MRPGPVNSRDDVDFIVCPSYHVRPRGRSIVGNEWGLLLYAAVSEVVRLTG